MSDTRDDLDTFDTEMRVRPSEVANGGTKPEVRYHGFVVNGTPLDDLIAGAAGHGWDYVAPLGHGPLAWQDDGIAALLSTGPSDLESGRVPVLVCGLCSHIGCGCVAVRVRIDGEQVEWFDVAYENGWEEPAPYEGIGTLRFSRSRYEQVIRATRTDPVAGTD